MWWGSESDPGGSTSDQPPSDQPPQNQQLQDLQEQFKQQQLFIAQLKDMLTKGEQTSAVSREKVEEYASTLSEINARAKRSRLKKTESKRSEGDESTGKGAELNKKAAVSTPAKEKVNLLRQQLEENRIKLAQRDKNQKGIEEMVNQLKAQLNTSQDIISQSKLNLSSEPKPASYAESSKESLIGMLTSRDEHILELSAKIQQLQANVLDLQENVKEKDSVIDARTKAITLLSENLSQKSKNTLDMLDETKDQMRKMQENFVSLESNMKHENLKLQTELSKKEEYIERLLQGNKELQEKCVEYESVQTELEAKLQGAQHELEIRKSEMKTCKCKIEELTKINESLQNQLSEMETTASPVAESADKPKGKAGKKSKQKDEPASAAVSVDAYVSRIAELEKIIEELKCENLEKTAEQPKPETVTENEEIQKLNKQLEDMNKNMIKLKAQHKSKLKEMQKKMNTGELNNKISTLEKENAKLLQGIAELEEEKGNLQLRLVEFESNKDKDYISDLENKIEEQKMEIENHIRSITSLESEITSKSNEISSLRSELSSLVHLENAQVCSEMTSVQLEEQLDKEVSQKKEIQDKYNGILKENEGLLEKIDGLNKEKQELTLKLENYMQENMDLIDRLEKLSAEKVSSAESIEIVESLTQQEKLEIEAYQKNLEFSPDKPSTESELEQVPEFTESVTKLSDETSELMERIELFTVERREVMDKMDSLATENQQLVSKLEKFEAEKSELETKYNALRAENEELTKQLQSVIEENKNLMARIEERAHERNLEEQAMLEDALRENAELKKVVEQCQLLVEEQKQEIVKFQEELLRKAGIEEEKSAIESNLLVLVTEKQTLEELNTSLTNQLSSLQHKYDLIRKENQESKRENAEQFEAKQKFEELLNTARVQIDDLEAQLKEKLAEINTLHSSIEENQNEHSQFDSVAQLQSQLDEKQSEIEDLQKLITDLNNEVEHKHEMNEENNKTINALSAQLAELKNVVTDNFQQLETYDSEMKQNSATIETLNEKLEELKNKILETEHVIEMKDIEISQLKAEKSANETKIANLEEELKSKHNNFVETCRQLKEKCQFLENQIKTNSGNIEDIRGPFEEKINELEARNKEQVEKMKKIAANLKKKANICQELETKLSDVTQKWEVESREKDEIKQNAEEYKEQLAESSKKIETLSNQLQEIDGSLCNLQINFASKNEECEVLKANYEEQTAKLRLQNELLNNKINDYESILEEDSKLRVELLDLKDANRNLELLLEANQKEIYNMGIQIDTLKVTSEAIKEQSVQELLNKIEAMNSAFETTKNALEAKIQEKDAFIESLDSENMKYKERISKLEEGLSLIEERREMLEQKAMDLKSELEAKASACEEAFQTEDILEQRLEVLMKHDEFVEQKLEQTVVENQTLNNKLEHLLKENGDLAEKLIKAQSKLKHIEQNDERIVFLESEVARLLDTNTALENEIKKLHVDFQHSLSTKNAEIENLEADLNTQVEQLSEERKTLHARCEMVEDNLKEYLNNEQMLNEEIDQLRQKLSNLKCDLDSRCEENEKLAESNAKYLAKLQEYETDVTDKATKNEDELLKSEMKKLQQVIAQKDVEIQNYQRQNMQLQMASFGGAPAASSFAVPFTPAKPDEVQKLNQLLEENTARCRALESQVSSLTEQLRTTQNELLSSEHNLKQLSENNQQLLHELDTQKQRELENQQQVSIKETIETGVQVRDDEEANKLKVISELERRLNELLAERDDLLKKLDKLSESTKIVQEEVFEKREHKHDTAMPFESERDVKMNELLAKIKALEFMLFNVEREKDDAMGNCQELLNELTRLIYEREKYFKSSAERPSREVDLASVEREIVSGDLEKDSDSVEFFPVQREQPTQLPTTRDFFANIPLQPVEEPLLQQKSAYLCYGDDKQQPAPSTTRQHQDEASGWGSEDMKIGESIESEIVSPESIPISPQERQQLQFLEFEHVRTPKGSSSGKPLREDIPAPKTAYLCYPDDCKGILSEDTFASEEDGWGWTAEEAKLEAAHMQTLAAPAPPQLNSQVQQLEEKIADLELERTRLLEEIKTSQVRSGKLIKKLKDMKQKNDSLVIELNKKSSGDCYDLDMAIQDELNTQIKNLEKTVKDLTDELNREKAERDNLVKRNEVLNAANERMLELKEKQDNEMQFLQFKNRELSSKLELMEWGDDSFSSKSDEKSPKKTAETAPGDDYTKQTDELNKKIEELTTTVNELTLDNEEMQCMLEEQRKLRIEAEKALVPIQGNVKSEEEFLELQREKQALDAELSKVIEEKKSLEENISIYQKTNEDLNLQTNQLHLSLERVIEEKELLSSESSKLINELNVENENLQNQICKLNLEISSLENAKIELDHLKTQLSTVEVEKQNLQILLNEKEIACQNLDSYLQQLEAAKSALESKLEEILCMQNTNNDNEEKIKELSAKVAATMADLEAKNDEIEKLNILLVTEREQFAQKLVENTEQLTQEWLVRVDERGSAVAENWKLHLEVRENEFAQIEHSLRAELNEAYRKQEALLNENKELQNKIEVLTVTTINTSNNEIEAMRERLKEKQMELQSASDELRRLKVALEKKDSEILSLNHAAEAAHMKDIELSKMKSQWIENEKHYEDILSTKDSDLESLRAQLNEHERRLTKEEADKINLQIQLDSRVTQCSELERKITELSSYLTEEQSEKDRLIAELQANIKNTTSLDEEINSLKVALQKEESNRMNLQTQLDLYLARNAELSAELARLQSALSEEQAAKFALGENLNLKTAECQELQAKVEELNQLSQEESKQIQELKDLIETQVQKTEELKQELLEKNNEYDALVAEIESLHHKETEKHVHFRDEVALKQALSKPSEEDNLAEPVSRAELDLALYMLHQRDVRCEELTVELMQLLEERDTLQLKLSNAIRMNEELKLKMSPSKATDPDRKSKDSPTRSTGTIPKSKSTAIVLNATGTELATEATETVTETTPNTADNKELAQKLSELRSVGYRDKTLKDDQEIRHLQQMTVMQQHRDLASRLPPEAAARLVDASYTLSRDVQSPSKVLLNWLWGRSTPKVNDI